MDKAGFWKKHRFLLLAFFYEQVLVISAKTAKALKERKEQKALIEKEEKKKAKEDKKEETLIKETKPLNDLGNVLVYDDEQTPHTEPENEKNPDRFDEILSSYEMPEVKEDDLKIKDCQDFLFRLTVPVPNLFFLLKQYFLLS